MSKKKIEVEEDEPAPFWKALIAHIDTTWKDKKGVPFYFRGQYFRELKELQRIYTPFGVMALWDFYLADPDEFSRKAGYSFEMFCSKIPKLLDLNGGGWKKLMLGYEQKFCGAYPLPIMELALDLIKKQAGPIEIAMHNDSQGPAVAEAKGQA